jgi:hypothetical protein
VASGGGVDYRQREVFDSAPYDPFPDAFPRASWEFKKTCERYFAQVVGAYLIATRSPVQRATTVLADLPHLEELRLEGFSKVSFQDVPCSIRLKRVILRRARGVDLRCFASNRELEELTLESCEFADDDLMPLKEFPELRSLRVDLHSRGSVPNAIEHISKLRQLETLELVSDRLTSHALKPLSALRSLRTLYLYSGGDRLTDEALKHFRDLPQLERLTIHGADFTAAGLAQLNERLIIVSLSGSSISDDELVCFQRLRNLKILALGETTISDSGIEALKQMPSLTRFMVDSWRVTDARINSFRRSLPKSHIGVRVR